MKALMPAIGSLRLKRFGFMDNWLIVASNSPPHVSLDVQYYTTTCGRRKTRRICD